MGQLRNALTSASRFFYPVSSVDKPHMWLRLIGGGGRRTTSNEWVNPESAMQLSAYYACLRNIAQDLAKLPVHLRKRRPERGSDRLWRNPLDMLIAKRPNPRMGSFQFRMVMFHRLLSWGNAYAEIVRKNGRIVELWPIHPSRIEPKPTPDGRSVTYTWTGEKGKTKNFTSREIFHLQAMGDGVKGYSILRFAAESLGLGLAAQRHAAAIFGEGLSKRLVAVWKAGKLTADARRGLRRKIRGEHQDDVEDEAHADERELGRRRIPILPGDLDIKDVGIPPGEAQLLETRTFTISDVARWFRMALAKLQHEGKAKGWGTLDALNTEYATDALHPWACVFEEECWMKLIPEANKVDHFFRVVLKGLLRGDAKSRADFYARMFNIGALNADEIREFEDENPIDDENGHGQTYYVQGALRAVGGPGAAKPAPAEPTPPPTEKDEDEKAEGDDPAEALRRTADAVLPAFRASAFRLMKMESRALSRAATRCKDDEVALREWSSKFYATLADHFDAELSPLVETFAALAGDDGAQHVANAVDEHRAAIIGMDPKVRMRISDPAEAAGTLAASVLDRAMEMAA